MKNISVCYAVEIDEEASLAFVENYYHKNYDNN